MMGETARRRRRIRYQAPILGGYEMQADIAPSDGPWRVVAIPGTPSRPHMFSRFMGVAPNDLDVVAVNRAGYGGPAYGPNRRAPVLSFEDQVAAIAPLFDRDDGKRTIVVGVSYGGALALKCALEHPDRIAGVVTVAMLVTEPRAFVNKITPLAGYPPLRQLLPGYYHNARAEVEGRRPQIEPLLARLAELTCPVTILHGGLDMLVAESDAHALRARFDAGADVEYEHWSWGTHYLELQAPRLLYRTIRGVIARAEAVHPGGGDDQN